jgi:hypothetical protein
MIRILFILLENDSVWIAPAVESADTLSNRQDNTMNRRVLLRVKETLPDYTVSIGPNPFNPHIDMITIRIDPKVRTRGSVRFRADVKIYDQIGNRVISISKENNPSESFLENVEWKEQQRKGGRNRYIPLYCKCNRSWTENKGCY